MCASRKQSPSNRGFLLFELVLSVIVLSISLTVISRSFIQTLTARQTSKRFFQAGLLIERKILELNQASFSEGKEEGTFEEFGGLFRWAVTTKEIEAPPLYEALVTVGWDSRGHERQLTITTYLPKGAP